MALALEGEGVSSEVFDNLRSIAPRISEFDAIVIVKRLDSSVVDLVSIAKDSLKPIIFDICDDILAAEYRANARELNRAVFRAILPLLDCIVTTGPGMTERLRDYSATLPAVIAVPDIAETREVLDRTIELSLRSGNAVGLGAMQQNSSARLIDADHKATKGVPSRWAIWRRRIQGAMINPPLALERFHRILVARTNQTGRTGLQLRLERAVEGALRPIVARYSMPLQPSSLQSAIEKGKPTETHEWPRVLWFGNHGAAHSTFGMLSLLPYADALNAVHSETPFVLEIVSNDLTKFNSFIAKLGLECQYTPWSIQGVYDALSRASVVLVTTGDDEFCEVKSANRVVQALAAGKPIIATPSPALKRLQNFIWLGDIGEGLRGFLKDPAQSKSQIAMAQKALAEEFSLDAAKQKYLEVLDLAVASATERKTAPRVKCGRPRLMFFLDLVQDLGVLKALIKRAQERDYEVCITATQRAGHKSQEFVQFLTSQRLIPTIVSEAEIRNSDARWLRAADVVVLAAESSLSAHRNAHAFCKLARSANISTVTLQHGLEVLGLTYLSDGPTVDFASDRIITWAAPRLLPEWLDQDIRNRCIGLGRSQSGRTTGVLPNPRAVGVFENLHWERYSNEYRMSFVDDLFKTADAVPNLTFYLHPHPAGKWFTKHAPRTHPNNIVISTVNESDRLLEYCSQIVTTPSTIALDAAHLGRPVSVAQYDLDALATFAPLPLLRSGEDWHKFIIANEDQKVRSALNEFAKRACEPGDATDLILDYIVELAQTTSSKIRGALANTR